MKVDTPLIHSASITRRRGVTSAKLTHTVAGGRYTTAPHLFPAVGLLDLGRDRHARIVQHARETRLDRRARGPSNPLLLAVLRLRARQRALLALDAPAALPQRRAPVVDPPLALALGANERLHELFAPRARLVSLAPMPGFVRALERRAVVGADRRTQCRRGRRRRPLWRALDAEEGIARGPRPIVGR